MQEKNNRNRKKYKFEKWNHAWISEFEDLKKKISPLFGTSIIAFEHVGSTSIPGISAKPIIDIVIVVSSLNAVKVTEEKMRQSGYELYEDYIAPKTWLFAKNINGERVQNTHVLPYGHEQIAKFIVKRDYFRSNPSAVKKYQLLKEDLRKKHPDDYVSYREGKSDFLDKVTEEALAWAKTGASRKQRDLYRRVGILE